MAIIKVLKDLNFTIDLVHIDDVHVFCNGFDEHLHHLNLVFTKCRKVKLKCTHHIANMTQKQDRYHGHIVSKYGMHRYHVHIVSKYIYGMQVNPENTKEMLFVQPIKRKQKVSSS